MLGVDGSAVGLEKAQRLAASQGVTIRTEVADLATYEPPEHSFGSVVSISAHLPSAVRQRLHRLVERSLIPGGIILLRGLHTRPSFAHTGGPKDPDMLMSAAELLQEFPHCEPILCQEIERDVVEGKFHTGLASVVQLIARKKA